MSHNVVRTKSCKAKSLGCTGKRSERGDSEFPFINSQASPPPTCTDCLASGGKLGTINWSDLKECKLGASQCDGKGGCGVKLQCSPQRGSCRSF
jgi:hypothetical protein